MNLEPITQQNIGLFKTVRLRALQEDPHAFGSTYAREVAFDRKEWRRRIERWSGDRGIGLLALDEAATPRGLVGILVSEEDASTAEVVSLWVAPEARRTGLGAQMMAAIELWSREHNVKTLRLGVTRDNDAALTFYQRCGFGILPTNAENPGVCGCEYTLTKTLAASPDAVSAH